MIDKIGAGVVDVDPIFTQVDRRAGAVEDFQRFVAVGTVHVLGDQQICNRLIGKGRGRRRRLCAQGSVRDQQHPSQKCQKHCALD